MRDLITLLSFLGAAQGLLLALAILARRGGDLASRLLGLSLLLGALAVAAVVLTHQPVAASWSPAAEVVETALWIVFGPLFYLYVHSVTRDRAAAANRLVWLHLAPGAAWAGYAAWTVGTGGARAVVLPPVLALMGYQLLYTALAAQRLVDRWDAARPAGMHRFWSVAWVAALAVQHLAQGVRYVWRDVRSLEDVVPATMAIVFLALTFAGFRRSGILGGAAGRERPRYAGSSLAPERAEAIARRLRAAFDEERVHLDPDLTLERLAERLGVPRNHLSQAINERLGRGFLELLQDHRIEEAKRLLADPRHAGLTVEAIAGRAGFKSRSAFYDAFRRAVGTTPAEFRERPRPPAAS